MLYYVLLPLKHALSVPPKKTVFTTDEVNKHGSDFLEVKVAEQIDR